MIRFSPINVPYLHRGLVIGLWLLTIFLPVDLWWLGLAVIWWQSLTHVVRQ